MSSPSPTPAFPSAPPSALLFSTVEDLAQALTAVGFPCDATSGRGGRGVMVGSCNIGGEFGSIAVYESEEKWVAFIPTLMHDPVWKDSVFLVGPNWGIGFDTTGTAEQVQREMGGEVLVGLGA